MFRFIHSSDLHLGRRFGNLPEPIRNRVAEARHGVIGNLAEAARRHGAEHVLLAGDSFDTETPAYPVWRQALAAIRDAGDVHWWIIPGNHDSLAAEALWDRLAERAPANVHALGTGDPVAIAPGVTLIPAPVTHRFTGRDPTVEMAAAATSPGEIRIGLAHGGVVGFGSEESDEAGREIISPDRDRSAGLAYLALGDWHRRIAISDRCHYSGTPEPDRFKEDARGVCLAVTVAGPEAVPEAAEIATGRFRWADRPLSLLPSQDAAEALEGAIAMDGADRRDVLLRIRAEGRATLAQQDALRRAAAEVEPEFGHFQLVTDGLATEFEAANLDEIGTGALREAADALAARARDDALAGADRTTAAAALNRLYGYMKEAEA